MATKRNYEMEALHICTQLSWEGGRGMPVLLFGSPGTAKTQVTSQLCKANAKELKARGVSDQYYHDLNVLPQTMPETIEGIAALGEDEHGNKVLVRYPQVGIRNLVTAKYGMWVGDEATSCTPATGAATMTLVQDGRAGDATLPDTVARVLCANPPECAAAGRDLSFPEINRLLVLRWKLPLPDLLDYLRGGPGLLNHLRWLPKGWETRYRPTASTLIAAYLESNPKHANTLDSGQTTSDQEGESWASERQWENLIRLLAAAMSLGEELSSQLCYLFMEGTVGKSVAQSLMGYIREFDLPSPEDVLRVALDPKSTDEDIKAQVPSTVWARPDKTRLMLESVAVFAQNAPEAHRGKLWTAAMRVLEPVLDIAPDNAMGAAKILMDHKPAGVGVPDVALKLFKAREKSGMSKSGGTKAGRF